MLGDTHRPNRAAMRKHADPLPMAIPRKAAVRFRERVELLDFLLEVSRLTSETLDLDKLLANVGSIVKDVLSYDLFAILLYNERDKGLQHPLFHRPSRRSGAQPDRQTGEGVTGAAAAPPAGHGRRRSSGPALSKRARRRAQ